MIGTEIKYKIDNFSELIDLDYYKKYNEEYNYLIKRDRKNKKESIIPLNTSGIYLFYNKEKEIVYIGKTKNCIKQRVHHHIINTISDYVINRGDFEENFRLYKRDKYKYLAYIRVDKNSIHFVESFLINKYNPIYNLEFNENFKMPEDFFLPNPNQNEIDELYHSIV